MEVKDIVGKEVARQAEFGMEPSWEDFVIAGVEAGRREVVEAVGTILGATSGEWEAKLKGWGIK